MTLRILSSVMTKPYRMAALISVLALSATSANAAASCWNKECDGKDSGVQGCRDGSQFNGATATIKSSSGSVWGHVDLVYSADCGAAWAYVASAIGTVSSISANIWRSATIAVPIASCTDCSVRRSEMLGDAGTEKCQAWGEIDIKVLGATFEARAQTSWF